LARRSIGELKTAVNGPHRHERRRAETAARALADGKNRQKIRISE
jgi:hypothetical protein